MFSRNTVIITVAAIFLAANFIILFLTSRKSYLGRNGEGVSITVSAPFQETVTNTVRFAQNTWRRYFFLVSVAEENGRLRAELGRAAQRANRLIEMERSNERLRELLDFKKNEIDRVVAAQVVGKDPSPWFSSLLIDKGRNDGVRKGMPVVIPEGIVGVITHDSAHYAKVLLIIDPNSAVDVLLQNSRVRGIARGKSFGICSIEYVLRRHDIAVGETVVTSGLGGVFPKGLRVGEISDVKRDNSGIFLDIQLTPFIDFETLEEVLVIVNAVDDPSESL